METNAREYRVMKRYFYLQFTSLWNGIKSLAHSEIESREATRPLYTLAERIEHTRVDTICKTLSSVEAIFPSHNKTQFHDATNRATVHGCLHKSSRLRTRGRQR